MKHLRKLTRVQKDLLKKNKFNFNDYLMERDLTEGYMFVDRQKTHRLFYDKNKKVFTRLEV